MIYYSWTGKVYLVVFNHEVKTKAYIERWLKKIRYADDVVWSQLPDGSGWYVELKLYRIQILDPLNLTADIQVSRQSIRFLVSQLSRQADGALLPEEGLLISYWRCHRWFGT